ncbi:MAG: PorT family protein [Muribaculaceae bacterium]|nr:PorT family protein [Muribaculaceae bacterium]
MIRSITAILLILVSALCGHARQLNDKLLNRQYADLKAWHLGFSVGVHSQWLRMAHNPVVEGADGPVWFVDQPALSPGFCVNGLMDLRLSTYFNVRFTPGLYFGNKVLNIVDASGLEDEGRLRRRQNIKSTLVVVPVDLKFSGLRYRNSRPYVTVGAMPAFDVSKRRSSDYFHTRMFDVYATVGFGCDFYLPYFKFIPELKFCFGLTDALSHKRPDLADDPGMAAFTQRIRKATAGMVVLTFYFE